MKFDLVYSSYSSCPMWAPTIRCCWLAPSCRGASSQSIPQICAPPHSLAEDGSAELLFQARGRVPVYCLVVLRVAAENLGAYPLT